MFIEYVAFKWLVFVYILLLSDGRFFKQLTAICQHFSPSTLYNAVQAIILLSSKLTAFFF